MAAKAKRPAAPAARPEPARAPEAAAAPANSWRGIAAVLLGFGALSAVVLALSLPGYRLQTRTHRAERAIAEGRYEDAIPNLEYIVRRYPLSTVRVKQLGDCYLETNRPKEAMAAYDRARELDPKLELDAEIGFAQFLLDNRAEAIRRLQAAQDRNPQEPKSAFYIGVVLMKEGRLADAAGYFQMATADPKLYEKSKPYLEEIRKQLLGE